MPSFSHWVSLWCLILIALLFGLLGIACFAAIATRGGSNLASIILAGSGLVCFGIAVGTTFVAWSARRDSPD
jgi:hypothetical protein